MAKHQLIHVVSYGYRRYGFKSLEKAASAIKFFSTLEPLTFNYVEEDSPSYWTPDEDQREHKITLDSNQPYQPCKPKKALLALPAPRRGTVPCAVCESVSVKPGHACQSCGIIAPL